MGKGKEVWMMDGYGWMDDGWVEGWMGGKVAYERENGRADWNR